MDHVYTFTRIKYCPFVVSMCHFCTSWFIFSGCIHIENYDQNRSRLVRKLANRQYFWVANSWIVVANDICPANTDICPANTFALIWTWILHYVLIRRSCPHLNDTSCGLQVVRYRLYDTCCMIQVVWYRLYDTWYKSTQCSIVTWICYKYIF